MPAEHVSRAPAHSPHSVVESKPKVEPPICHSRGELEALAERGSGFFERWVTRPVRLSIEAESTAELTAYPGARVLLLEKCGDTARALVTAFEADSELDDDDPLRGEPRPFKGAAGIVVSLPVSALATRPVPLAEPSLRADARDLARRLFGAPDAVNIGVSLACGPLEIEADLPGNVQRLRQVHEGFELRGVTRVPVRWSWEDNRCALRVVRADEQQAAVPVDFMRVDPTEANAAVRFLSRGTQLYQVQLDDDVGLRCAQVTYRDGDLAKVAFLGPGKTRSETIYSAGFSKDGTSWLDGPTIRDFDERGRLKRSVSFGCSSPIQLVRETATALEFFNSDPLFAYHPSDVTRWYKSKASCEQAVAEHPRVRIESGRHEQVALLPLMLGSGC